MISYHDAMYSRFQGVRPDAKTPPAIHTDIAPFPLWLVPPAWRMAKLAEVAAAFGKVVSPTIAEVTAAFDAMHIRYHEHFDLEGLIGPKTPEPVALFEVQRVWDEAEQQHRYGPTGEWYVLWQTRQAQPGEPEPRSLAPHSQAEGESDD